MVCDSLQNEGQSANAICIWVIWSPDKTKQLHFLYFYNSSPLSLLFNIYLRSNSQKFEDSSLAVFRLPMVTAGKNSTDNISKNYFSAEKP